MDIESFVKKQMEDNDWYNFPEDSLRKALAEFVSGYETDKTLLLVAVNREVVGLHERICQLEQEVNAHRDNEEAFADELQSVSSVPAGQSVPVVGDAEACAKSVASMIEEWVQGGVENGGDWKEGLPNIILRRIRRFWPVNPIPVVGEPVAWAELRDMKSLTNGVLKGRQTLGMYLSAFHTDQYSQPLYATAQPHRLKQTELRVSNNSAGWIGCHDDMARITDAELASLREKAAEADELRKDAEPKP